MPQTPQPALLLLLLHLLPSGSLIIVGLASQAQEAMHLALAERLRAKGPQQAQRTQQVQVPQQAQQASQALQAQQVW